MAEAQPEQPTRSSRLYDFTIADLSAFDRYVRDRFTREPDTDYVLDYEPADPSRRVILRTINGVFQLDIGEIVGGFD